MKKLNCNCLLLKMNNKNYYLAFFLLFTLISGCSFDKKTGIWSGSEEEQARMRELEREQKSLIEVVKIYSSSDLYSKEIPSNKTVRVSQPIKNTSWLMSGLNSHNNMGHIYLSGTENNFLKAKKGKNKFTISKVISSPLFFDNSIFFTDDTGTVFNINQRGKVIWKKNIYKKAYKKIYKNLSLAIYENKIFISDNIGFIYAIDLQSGKLLWIKNHGIPIKSNIKIFDDKIFVINQDNRILCFNIKDGSLLWDVRAVSSFIKSQSFSALAISKQGELVALTSSGDLLKININTGRIFWSQNIMGSMFAHDTDFFKSSDIVIVNKDIFFTTMSSIFSFNLQNGLLNWNENVDSTNTPIIDLNNIFLFSDNGFFINIDKKTGKMIWSINVLKVLKKKKQNTKVTGFIMGSGKIYATTLNGYLIQCSAVSGNVENVKKIGDLITAAPIISDGALYILTDKSRIFGFN